MTILVVGASGATGKLLVKELLNRGHKVKAIVRSTEKLSEFLDNKNMEVINASVLELSDAEIAGHVKGYVVGLQVLNNAIFDPIFQSLPI